MLNSNSNSLGNEIDEEIKQTERLSDSEFYSAAVVPIAIPLTVGGATLSAVVLFSETATRTNSLIDLYAAVSILVLVNYIIFRFSSKIIAFLGSMGVVIFIKIMGLFTLSIGIQFLAQGIGAFYLKYRELTTAPF